MKTALTLDTKRVVLVWIGRLGDILIATPFYEAVRKAAPNARITLVTGEAGLAGAELSPGIDEILVLKRASSPLHNLKIVRALRAEEADLLVDLNSAFSRAAGILCRLARAKEKAAFERPRGNGAFSILAGPAGVEEHMLDRYARLGAAIGIETEGVPRAVIPERARERVRDEIAKIPGEGPFVVVHPGNFKKYDNRWPEEKFSSLLARSDARFVLFAGPGEREAVEEIAVRAGKKIPVIGPTPIAVTAALLERAELFIGNSTGSAHLAAAVGTKTLTFLGAYTKKIWMPQDGGPEGPRHFQLVSEAWNLRLRRRGRARTRARLSYLQRPCRM
jgi:ADP-heptose:LPS heptosyltransferase